MAMYLPSGRRLAGGKEAFFSFCGERDALTHSEDDIFKMNKQLRCWMGEEWGQEWRGQERQTDRERNLCCPYFLIFPAELGSVVRLYVKEG